MKHLFNMSQETVVQIFDSQKRISWNFTSPSAPRFKGLWEEFIKLTK